jgi:hypothetical protein
MAPVSTFLSNLSLIIVVFTQQSILVHNFLDFISFLVTFIVFSLLTFLCT